MLRYNLQLIFRNFNRNRSTFFINWIGLSTALACVILIYFWVNDEWNIDRYHAKSGRLYQVMEHTQTEGEIQTSGQTAEFLATALLDEMPEIEQAVVVTPPNFFPTFTLSDAQRHVKGVAKFADREFFTIFSYDLIHGEAATALKDKNSIVISESLAKALFTTAENSLGKSIQWQVMGLQKDVMVSGVFKDLQSNSWEQFDFVLPFDSFRDIMGMTAGAPVNWDASAPFFTYIVLKEGSNAAQTNDKLENLLRAKSKNSNHRTLFLKPFSDRYLYGTYENGKVAGGRIDYLKLFSIIAIFIVAIASINFINLSTARTVRRAKDAGIKKVLGAQRMTLIAHNLLEAFVITALSFCLAITLVYAVLPKFNVITGKNLTVLWDMGTIGVFSVGILLTTFLAGSYPAFYFSGFNPVNVLKGHFSTSAGALWSRKGLVVLQFTVTMIFIVSVVVVYKQIEFIQTKNLGYDKENVIYFEADGKVAEQPETFLTEIRKLQGVEKASSMLGNLVSVNKVDGGGTPGTVSWNGTQITVTNSAVNYELLELLGIKLKEGRAFSRDFPSDADKIIYNETAIKALGITDPVGKVVGQKEIIGVVEDFHFQSFHEAVKPYAFRLEPQAASTIMIRIRPGTERQTLEGIQTFLKAFNPGYSFTYRFLDEDYQTQYVAERRVELLSRYASALAIVISCLGLFGLVSYTVERRDKEIGIRKVLGSSVTQIVLLLSGDFLKMVLIAILIAIPLSFFWLSEWLDSFAYRIDLHAIYFAVAAGLTILMAWLTIGMQTLKAAKANPVERLRSE